MGNILPPDLRQRTKSLGPHARTISASVKTMHLGSPVRSLVKPIAPAAHNRPRPVIASPNRHPIAGSPRRPLPTARNGPVLDQATMAPPVSRLGRAATSTRRPSLSAGALPMPTSASHPRMELPKPTGQRERTRSAMHPADIIGTQRQIGSTKPRPESSSITAPRPAPSVTTARSMMPPPSRPAVPRAGSARTGTSVLPSTARAPLVRPAQSGAMGPPTRATGFRPTSMAPLPPKSSLPPTASRAPASTSVVRPGLTRPSASTTSQRAFGGDGTAQTNRLARPTASIAAGLPKPSSRAVLGKMSMAPTSPIKRDTTSLKSRAASTPADTVTRALIRPSTAKSSIPPIGTQPVAGTSALPRPGASRMPAPSTSKLSTGPTAGANRRGDSTQINALRARIDAISARQAVPRRA